MIDRKTILSTAGGVVLTAGLIVILVLITAFLPPVFSPSVQASIPLFIFALSLLVVAPLLSRSLYRLPDTRKMLGWILMGGGAELVALPVPLLVLVLKFPSAGGLFLGGIILTYSVVFGIPAGLVSIMIGVFLLRRR